MNTIPVMNAAMRQNAETPPASSSLCSPSSLDISELPPSPQTSPIAMDSTKIGAHIDTPATRLESSVRENYKQHQVPWIIPPAQPASYMPEVQASFQINLSPYCLLK